MKNTGYILKGKNETTFARSYIAAGNCFTVKVKSALIFNDEVLANNAAAVLEGKPPYKGYKREDLEIVPVSVHEEGDVPDLSWLWHCAEDDAKFAYKNKDQQNAAAFSARLTLRKLEGVGIIQLSDIDRSKSEEDQKTFDKNSLGE